MRDWLDLRPPRTSRGKSTALAFADDGITVNAIAPGPADTQLFREAIEQLAQTDYTGGHSPDEHVVESATHIPLKRLATVEDIAQLFLFLASDQSGYINGVTVAIDGGYLLT
ncbi:MAG: SDR family oxidoreductase [Nocardioidaceae bacterium]|nr:MAG: SDR family oxidoreductase [Nocardioidaceae bacterium]